MNKENLGKCATDQAIRKITFKKNPKTGKISKVIKITHTQKCSQDKELIALEGKEEENKLLDDDEEQDEEINMSQAPQDEAEETRDKEMDIIREEFRRYLRGVIK